MNEANEIWFNSRRNEKSKRKKGHAINDMPLLITRAAISSKHSSCSQCVLSRTHIQSSVINYKRTSYDVRNKIPCNHSPLLKYTLRSWNESWSCLFNSTATNMVKPAAVTWHSEWISCVLLVKSKTSTISTLLLRSH